MLARSDDVLQRARQRTVLTVAHHRFGQRLQGDTRQVEALDALLADVLEQTVEIQSDISMDQRQFATGAQGAEHLLEGNVKAQGRELQGADGRAALLLGLFDLPLHQVDQGPVRHGNALGLAGGTRGIDDIRQAVGAQAAHVRIGLLLGADTRGIACLGIE